MNIAFVMDDLSVHSNGTSVTAMRYADALRRQGHEVRLVGFGAHGPEAFPVAEHFIPVVSTVSDADGFHFARPDDSVFDEAFESVDVIHLFLPFMLERYALEWARRRRVPVSAAFHLMPESITYGADIGSAPLICDGIYRLWRDRLYDEVRHVHTISPLMKRLLEKHGYRSQIHVISNGVPDRFVALDGAAFDDGLVHVVTVGRLAHEKNQKVIIEAVGRSRYADRIQLHVCGSGPLLRHLRKMGERLPHPPDFAYLDAGKLVELEQKCPLYVHASVVDSEAISVVEAFTCGCVPIIGQAPLSAPAEFALTDESLFPATDAEALAARIDWWIEHPDELKHWRERYIAEGETLRIDRCVEQFAAMERAAIADDRAAYA